MIEISKEEMEVLIDKGFLRLRNGKYPGLTICSKRKKVMVRADLFRRILRKS